MFPYVLSQSRSRPLIIRERKLLKITPNDKLPADKTIWVGSPGLHEKSLNYLRIADLPSLCRVTGWVNVFDKCQP